MSEMPTIPDFRLPASRGQTLSLDSFIDKVPLALVFLDPHSADGVAVLDELDHRHRDFGEARSQILVFVKETARSVREIADTRELSIPILADASGAVGRDYGFEYVDDGPGMAMVTDESGSQQKRFEPFPDGADPTSAVESLLSTVRAVGSGSPGKTANRG